MLSYIVDVCTVLVQIMNTSSKNVYLFKNNKFGIVQNYEQECYLANEENVF